MKTKKIAYGLGVAILTFSLFNSSPVLADSFFKDLMKVSGNIAKKAGEAIEELGEKRKDSFFGKGLKIGGSINKAVGTAVEKAADELNEPEEK